MDPSTLHVTVDVPCLDVEVTEMRAELNVYATDANGVFLYNHLDIAIWLAEEDR